MKEEQPKAWCKGSLCDSDSCVEVQLDEAIVRVRNSNDTAGPLLEFTVAEWEVFLGGVRLGEFDAPPGV